jgi:ankyrin repeat protein
MLLELDVVRYLVRKAPTTVLVASHEGMLPVHYAMLHGISLPAARHLVERWSESLQSRTPDGFSLLHLAVTREEPSLAHVDYVVEQNRQLSYETDKTGSLPIHVAVARNQPVEIVRFLVEESPKSLQEPDRTGSLALHIAVAQDAPSMPMVRFLAQERPESLDATDKRGRVPLHIAVARANASLELVRLLVKRRRETLRRRDGNRRLALHVAAMHGAPLDVLFLLASEWPEAISG